MIKSSGQESTTERGFLLSRSLLEEFLRVTGAVFDAKHDVLQYGKELRRLLPDGGLFILVVLKEGGENIIQESFSREGYFEALEVGIHDFFVDISFSFIVHFFDPD